jgi:hypothetical protein
MNATAAALLALAITALTGCMGVECSPGADFRALGIADPPAQIDPAVADRLGRQPASAFPAVVAAMRIQGPGFREGDRRGLWAPADGKAVVVTVRDVERQEDFDRLAKLPLVSAVIPVNGLAAPSRISSETDLRAAAGSVHADLLLLYTIDTTWRTETTLPLVGGLTLGAFPNRSAVVTSTAAGALLDVRTGYVYTLAEATNHQEQIANTWTSDSAVDQTRRRTERKAFEGLLDSFERSWPRVVACACPPPKIWTTPPPQAPPVREYVIAPAPLIPVPPIPVQVVRPTPDGWDQVPRGVPYRTR